MAKNKPNEKTQPEKKVVASDDRLEAAPPKDSDTSTRRHHIRASRGEEIPFYNRPQLPVK